MISEEVEDIRKKLKTLSDEQLVYVKAALAIETQRRYKVQGKSFEAELPNEIVKAFETSLELLTQDNREKKNEP